MPRISPWITNTHTQHAPHARAHTRGVKGTYVSRSGDGEALYVTHHFTQPELTALLAAAGFDVVQFLVEKETSSRRKGMAAYFYYIVARKL